MMNKKLFVIFLLSAAAIMPVATNTMDQPEVSNDSMQSRSIPHHFGQFFTSPIYFDSRIKEQTPLGKKFLHAFFDPQHMSPKYVFGMNEVKKSPPQAATSLEAKIGQGTDLFDEIAATRPTGAETFSPTTNMNCDTYYPNIPKLTFFKCLLQVKTGDIQDLLKKQKAEKQQ